MYVITAILINMQADKEAVEELDDLLNGVHVAMDQLHHGKIDK